jgi:methionyl aminopeptidase
VIIRKTEAQVDRMRRAGRLVGHTLSAVCEAARPGVTLAELDALAERVIRGAGGTPSFLGYQPHPSVPPFPGTLCLSPNDWVVHGVPGSTVLQEGDILSVDCGAIVDGWHGDAAVTIPIGAVDEAGRRLIAATEQAMWAGIAKARPGGRLSDIGAAVEQSAAPGGWGVVAQYGGHGIGTRMHEEPHVPNHGRPGRGLRLATGLVLAIEPMLNEGDPDTQELGDGWTVVTCDGRRSAHFEHTVALTADGPEVLTLLAGADQNDWLDGNRAVAT